MSKKKNHKKAIFTFTAPEAQRVQLAPNQASIKSLV